jgi:hypothetical protein
MTTRLFPARPKSPHRDLEVQPAEEGPNGDAAGEDGDGNDATTQRRNDATMAMMSSAAKEDSAGVRGALPTDV